MTVQDLLNIMVERGEMRRDEEAFHFSDMLQNIIYFFNQVPIRDHLIHHYQKMLPHGKHAEWDGTYYFDENGIMDPHYHPECKNTSLLEFIQTRPVFKKKKKGTFIMFTSCILYEDNRVHFLSFIYKPEAGVLVSFDPGINLYHKGQEVLIPLIQKSFIRAGLIKKGHAGLERVGLCRQKYHNKNWGIQYDGSDPNLVSLPADSFCQSWTLFFLIEFLRQKCTDSFISSWCQIPPAFREHFIISYYFLPWLQQDPFIYKEFRNFYPQGDISILLHHITGSFKNAVRISESGKPLHV